MSLFDFAQKITPSGLWPDNRANGYDESSGRQKSTTNGAKQNGHTTALSRTSSTTAAITFEVAHHVPGRIRLRIPRLAHDAAFTDRVIAEVASVPSVTAVRANRRTQSLVVEYTRQSARSTIPTAMAQQLARAIQDAAAGKTALTLRQPVAVSAEKSVGFGRTYYLQKLTLPALGLGLSAGVIAGMAIPPVLVGGTILVAALPIFKRTAEGIRDEKKLTVDFLDSTTIVLLTAQTSFAPSAFIVGVIEGSEVLRDWTARRSQQASLALLLDQERLVTVEHDGKQCQTPVEEVVVDDIIVVYPGDQIPVDGVVLDGQAMVDQHQVTGDSIPVLCAAGDSVHASTLVLEGTLRLRAQHTGHDTHVGQVMAAMQDAPATDTRVSNYARKVGNWAVLPTLAIGGLVFGTSGNLARATSIVSMDLGTGMRVSAPIAILTAQTNAARQGILIRSGQALEALTQIDTIVFDKTATLTEGRAKITSVDIVNDSISAEHLITLAASAEQTLGHPIAESIVRYAHDLDVEIRPCTDWEYNAGLGVAATIDGQTVHVGNRHFMAQLGIDVAELEAARDRHLHSATHVYVAVDDDLAGVITCADPLRPNAATVIAHLQDAQITPLLVSGDSQPVVSTVAETLGVATDHVFAEMLPEQKLHVVQSLQAQGRCVAFVGDGVNDAAAMAHANVSITLGGATDLALESADIVLTNNDLDDLLNAMDIAHHAMRIIRQNKALNVIPNVSGIAYASVTVMNPVVGVVINNGSAALSAINSLRPLKEPKSNVGRLVQPVSATGKSVMETGEKA